MLCQVSHQSTGMQRCEVLWCIKAYALVKDTLILSKCHFLVDHISQCKILQNFYSDTRWHSCMSRIATKLCKWSWDLTCQGRLPWESCVNLQNWSLRKLHACVHVLRSTNPSIHAWPINKIRSADEVYTYMHVFHVCVKLGNALYAYHLTVQLRIWPDVWPVVYLLSMICRTKLLCTT